MLGQRPYKFIDVGYADAGNHVVARTCAEFTIASRLDITKTRRSHQRVDQWIQKWQRWQTRSRAGFIHQRAKTSPDGCAPTRSANLRYLVVQNEKGTGVGVRHETDIRHESRIAARNTFARLPSRSIEKDTLPSAAAGPSRFARNLTTGCEGQARTADCDHARIG